MASISKPRRLAGYLAAVGIAAVSFPLAGWAVSTAPATVTAQAVATCESDNHNFRNLDVSRDWYDDGAGGCEDGGSAAFVSYIRVAHRAPDTGTTTTRWKSAFGYNWIQATADPADGGKPGLVGQTVDLVAGGTREVNAACLVNVGPSTTYIAWPNKNGIGTS
jgi:hypothetical protein